MYRRPVGIRARSIALGLLAFLACSRTGEPPQRHAAESSAAPTSAEAPTPHPIDASTPVPTANVPFAIDRSLLTGVTVASNSLDQDATDLGHAIEVHVVRELGGQNGSTRLFALWMVLRGEGGLAIPLEGNGFGEDGYPEPWERPTGTVEPIAPLGADDDRDPASSPVGVRIPTRKPLLYRFQFHIPGADDYLAVVHDGGQLRVYYFWTDEGARCDAWELIGSVRLARGATVTAL